MLFTASLVVRVLARLLVLRRWRWLASRSGNADGDLWLRGWGLIRTIAAIGAIHLAVTLSMFVRPAAHQMDAPANR